MSTTLAQRLGDVEQRLAAACERSGRRRSDVTLVAVTKLVTAEQANEVANLGVLDLGENRPQELWRKAALLPATVRWHLIGHLQRNKIDRTLPLTQLIHSVDSVRLLEGIEQEAKKQSRRAEVLLEVNAGGEAAKSGFAPEEVSGLVPALLGLQHVSVRGLMTMAPLQDAERCRPVFAALRELRDRMRPLVAERHDLAHLSMGMSNDFEVAVEEGATFVRLGAVLWE